MKRTSTCYYKNEDTSRVVKITGDPINSDGNEPYIHIWTSLLGRYLASAWAQHMLYKRCGLLCVDYILEEP